MRAVQADHERTKQFMRRSSASNAPRRRLSHTEPCTGMFLRTAKAQPWAAQIWAAYPWRISGGKRFSGGKLNSGKKRLLDWPSRCATAHFRAAPQARESLSRYARKPIVAHNLATAKRLKTPG